MVSLASFSLNTMHPAPLSKPVSSGLLIAGVGLSLWPAISGAMALTLGLVVGLSGANVWIRQTSAMASRLLQISIVGLGASMNLAVVWAVGIQSIEYTLIGITITLTAGLWLGKKSGLSRNISILVASGTAICGGSAIAAVACVLKPLEEENYGGTCHGLFAQRHRPVGVSPTRPFSRIYPA